MDNGTMAIIDTWKIMTYVFMLATSNVTSQPLTISVPFDCACLTTTM